MLFNAEGMVGTRCFVFVPLLHLSLVLYKGDGQLIWDLRTNTVYLLMDEVQSNIKCRYSW